MIRLKVLSRNGSEKVVEAFEPVVYVGRSPDCTVTIGDSGAEWKHGQFQCRREHYWYRDLRSRNGSRIWCPDGREKFLRNTITEVRLSAGDRIEIGSTEIEILSIEANLYVPAGQGSMPIVESRSEANLDGILDRVAKDNKVLEQIYRFERHLSDVFDLNSLFSSISDSVFEVFDKATHLFVALVEGEKFDLVLASRRPGLEGDGGPATLSRLIVDQAVREGEALIFNVTDAGSLQLQRRDPREIDPTESVSLNRIQSGICAPLWSGKSIIGVMEIDNRVEAASFTEEEQNLLVLFANRVALAIEKHRRYSERLQAARDATIGQVVSKVVHDLTNHFGVLRPLGELTEHDLQSLEEHVLRGDLDKQGIHGSLVSLRDRWQRIRLHHELMWNLLDDLRHYARPREPEYAKVPVRDVVDVCLQISEFRAKEREKDIEFRVSGDRNEIFFLADAIGVRRALQNLLNNAVDAIPSGVPGKVEIEVGPDMVDGLRYISFSVVDNGSGIPEDLLDKVFDYGFSTKPGLSGSGFGLAVIRKVMKEHRGFIRLTSRKDEGTRVQLLFPALRVADHIRRYPDREEAPVLVVPCAEQPVPA
jgi:signal transduction histidine kinase